jgi:hypothetical protein
MLIMLSFFLIVKGFHSRENPFLEKKLENLRCLSEEFPVSEELLL